LKIFLVISYYWSESNVINNLTFVLVGFYVSHANTVEVIWRLPSFTNIGRCQIPLCVLFRAQACTRVVPLKLYKVPGYIPYMKESKPNPHLWGASGLKSTNSTTQLWTIYKLYSLVTDFMILNQMSFPVIFQLML
jgi:hypothetical protein